MIYVETVLNPGQRAIFKWSVVVEDLTLAVTVAHGDSYYKWNAKRAARRAAKRYLGENSPVVTEIYTERFEENAP